VKLRDVASLVVLSMTLIPAPAPALQDAAQAPATAAPAAPSKPYEDVIKLWKANLSEDFIKRQIQTGSTVYDLSADDVIRCRDAGLPESLINVMLDTRNRKPGDAKAPAPAPQAIAPAQAAPPAGAPPAAPSLAAEANRRWEGLARRNGGVVVFKSRWDVGVLEFKEETVRWVDAKDSAKNLLIPARSIT